VECSVIGDEVTHIKPVSIGSQMIDRAVQEEQEHDYTELASRM